MLVLGIVAALLMTAVLAPDGVLGEALIRAPARFLAWLTPWGALMALLPALVVIGLFVSGLELVALLGLADFSVLVMVGLPALVLGVGARLAILRQRIVTGAMRVVAIAGTIARPPGSRRERRRPRRTRPRPRRSDDADDAGWAWA
jgi:hypothetical protein